MKPEIREIIKWAEGLGWRLDESGAHYKLRYGKKVLVIAKTPSEYRSLKNTEADIRRYTPGNVPPRVTKKSGKFRKGTGQPTGYRSRFDIDAAVAEQQQKQERRQELHLEIGILKSKLEFLGQSGRRNLRDMQAIARKIIYMERECRFLGCTEHGR